jgi:hypothetical protein
MMKMGMRVHSAVYRATHCCVGGTTFLPGIVGNCHGHDFAHRYQGVAEISYCR